MKGMKNIGILLLFLIQAFYVNLILADLPIHVMVKDLVGKWKILKTADSPYLTTCGSTQPNTNLENIKIKDYKKYLLNNNFRFVSEMEVILSDDFVSYGEMYDTTGNEHRADWKVLVVYNIDKEIIGTWTTIVDEGFEIRMGNVAYTALMHYEPTGKCEKLTNSDNTDVNGESDCYVTDTNRIRFGWVDTLTENNEQLHSCFYAEKILVLDDDNNDINPNSELFNDVTLSKLQIDNNLRNEPDSSSIFDYIDNGIYKTVDDMKFDKNSELSWHKNKHHSKKRKALKKSLSMYSKRKYACPCSQDEDVENQNSVKHQKTNGPVSPNFLQNVKNIYKNDSNFKISEAQTNELDYNNYEEGMRPLKKEFDISELPRNFTWGDAFNKNVRESTVSNQLLCGSCYILSHMYVLRRRIEISLTKILKKKYNKELEDILSIQSILSCSFYDQGCNGGYPFLVSKHAMLQGIPLANSLPYQGVNAQCPYSIKKVPTILYKKKKNTDMLNLNNYLGEFNPYEFDNFIEERIKKVKYENSISIDDPTKWYVKNYNYIGGCYGCNQCNGEKIMMNEIYANGPIVASFEASPNFYKYKDGIYYIKDYPHAKKCSIDINKKDLKNSFNSYNITGWEKVNHAIAIVGWGEDKIDGKIYKYWIGKNSWGKNWGKDGYFKIIRGINFNAIESHTMFIDPDFTRGIGKIILSELMDQ
ncbi:dipeptidyl aminopeptidase 1, putative [Hepatocystis sp. ex Piliocolobus tephrosceles]|nr:dipeptidyl aminopeptidase 1, putative [Hepatocystis sp. ex Piliocolobus tephrosceles]